MNGQSSPLAEQAGAADTKQIACSECGWSCAGQLWALHVTDQRSGQVWPPIKAECGDAALTKLPEKAAPGGLHTPCGSGLPMHQTTQHGHEAAHPALAGGYPWPPLPWQPEQTTVRPGSAAHGGPLPQPTSSSSARPCMAHPAPCTAEQPAAGQPVRLPWRLPPKRAAMRCQRGTMPLLIGGCAGQARLSPPAACHGAAGSGTAHTVVVVIEASCQARLPAQVSCCHRTSCVD